MTKLQALFKERNIPQSLIDLYAFDKGCEHEYNPYFHIVPEYNMSEFLYPDNQKFSSRIIEFAQGGESLASYALWIPDDIDDCEAMPVVFMESGSGMDLIAPNLKDFLIVLSYDVECSGDFYYKNCEEYEASPYHDLYVKWLKEKQNLTPIPECEDDNDTGYKCVTKIINSTKEKFGDQFNRWLHVIENGNDLIPLDETVDTNQSDFVPTTVRNFNDLIDLLYLRMDNPVFLGAVDAINLKRPILDGNYLKEKNIYLSNEDDSVYWDLRDLEEEEKSSLSRIPYLLTVAITKKSTMEPPFGITFEDDYVTVVSKIGKEAEYQHCISDEMKIWILKTPTTDKNYELTIDFQDETLEKISNIVISDEDQDNRIDNLAN